MLFFLIPSNGRKFAFFTVTNRPVEHKPGFPFLTRCQGTVKTVPRVFNFYGLLYEKVVFGFFPAVFKWWRSHGPRGVLKADVDEICELVKSTA